MLCLANCLAINTHLQRKNNALTSSIYGLVTIATCFIQIFLGYVNTHYNIYESKSLDDEIEVFRLCGFTKRAGYRYVNCIKHVYKNDSTLNWIYRLIEGMICDNSHINLSNFLKECYKNIDTSIDDNRTDIQEDDDDDDDEDEYDSDDVILILNIS